MKTPTYLTYSLRFIMVFALVLLWGSCQKTVKMQTFNDVFDTSGIDVLNSKIATAKTTADLPIEFNTAGIVVPEGIKLISPSQIAAWYSKNIMLSDDEVDLLLKNDSKTYIDVINRMASYPPEMGQVKASDFTELKASSLNKYLLKQINEPENFYSTDYYSAVVALQDYLKIAVIEPMNQVAAIPDGDINPSFLVSYKLITSNNIWDMWWAYWSDGKRTKHKGATGSFPG